MYPFLSFTALSKFQLEYQNVIKWNVGGLTQPNRGSSQTGPASLPTVARRHKLSVKCKVDSKQCTVGAKFTSCQYIFRQQTYNPGQTYRGNFQTSTSNTPPPPQPLPPCNVVMLLCLCAVWMISVAINIGWGRGFQKSPMTAPPSCPRNIGQDCS